MRLALIKMEQEASLLLRFAVYSGFRGAIEPYPDSTRQNRCVARFDFSGYGGIRVPHSTRQGYGNACDEAMGQEVPDLLL